MELNIQKFNPLKAEVNALVENIKSTIISLPNNITGYELMKNNKKLLQNKRIDFVRELKLERDGAIKFQKYIVSVEKDLLGLVEPLESELDEKIKEIEDIEKKEKRKKLLPERIAKLETIDMFEVSPDYILSLDDNQFNKWFNEQKEIYLFNIQENIIKEQEKIEAEKLKIEQEKKIGEIRRKVEKEAQEKAIRDMKIAELKAEEDKRVAIENEKQKAAKEKRDIIDKQKRKDEARIEAEKKIKFEADEKIRTEKEAQEKLEKQKKYQKFLSDNNYNIDEDYLLNKEDKIILMRKVAEFIK